MSISKVGEPPSTGTHLRPWLLKSSGSSSGWFFPFFDSVLESLINPSTSVVRISPDACLFAHSGFIFLYDVILLSSCLYVFIVSLILLCCLPLLLLPQLSRREKIFDQMMLRCSTVIWEERANEEVMNGIHAYGNSSKK